MAENEAAAVRAVGGSASYDFLATNAALVAGPHSPHGLAPPATSAHDPVALVKEHYRAGRDSPERPQGKIHRVDPKFASLPNILTENPYKSLLS
jgi:hypothetical protein